MQSQYLLFSSSLVFFETVNQHTCTRRNSSLCIHSERVGMSIRHQQRVCLCVLSAMIRLKKLLQKRFSTCMCVPDKLTRRQTFNHFLRARTLFDARSGMLAQKSINDEERNALCKYIHLGKVWGKKFT